jgi:hypothetical protein
LSFGGLGLGGLSFEGIDQERNIIMDITSMEMNEKKTAVESYSRPMLIAATACILVLFAGCEVIGGIFKAGMAIGIVVVLLVVFLIMWLMRKMRGR